MSLASAGLTAVDRLLATERPPRFWFKWAAAYGAVTVALFVAGRRLSR